jgi:hypothetical protein
VYAQVELHKPMPLSENVGDTDDWYNSGTVTTDSDAVAIGPSRPSMHTSPPADLCRTQDAALLSFIPASHFAQSRQPPQQSVKKRSARSPRSGARKKRRLNELRSVDATQARTSTDTKGKANDRNPGTRIQLAGESKHTVKVSSSVDH